VCQFVSRAVKHALSGHRIDFHILPIVQACDIDSILIKRQN